MEDQRQLHRRRAMRAGLLLCLVALTPACLLPEVWDAEDPADVSQVASDPGGVEQAPTESAAATSEAAPPAMEPAANAAADPQLGNAQAGMPAIDSAASVGSPGAMAAVPMTSAAPGAAGGGSSAPGSAAAGSHAAPASAGAAGRGGAAGASSAGVATGMCGPENTNATAALDKLGPWAPAHVESTGPSGKSWIFYPADLGKNGMKHPVFDWGPGAGTGPDSYVDHLNILASQGFVIISQASTESGKDALTWLLAENDKPASMFYQKLDAARVGRGGHSMGALQSFSESSDPRLTLYVLVCGGGNGTGGAADIHAPSIFLGADGESGTTNFDGDFAAIKSAPSYFVTKTDTDHIYCPRNNLAPWVAFMRMTWCGEKAKYQKELSTGGAFCSSPWLACKSKNL